MRAEFKSEGWNELQFLSWVEFRQMAPSILQLEVTRLGKVMKTLSVETGFRNSLARARFDLTQFVSGVEKLDKNPLDEESVSHLRAAIMSLSFPPGDLSTETRKTCRYVLDRLNYVYNRIDLIY